MAFCFGDVPSNLMVLIIRDVWFYLTEHSINCQWSFSVATFQGYVEFPQGPLPNPEKTWKDWSTALKKEPRPPGPKMSQGRSSWGSSRSHRASWSAGDSPSGWTHQASATPHALVSQYSQACLDNTLLTWLGACLFGRWLYAFTVSEWHGSWSQKRHKWHKGLFPIIQPFLNWSGHTLGPSLGWYTPFSDTPWYHIYMLYRCYPDKILLTSHWYRYCARIIWLYPPFPYSIATSSEIFRHGRPFSFWPRGRDAAGKRKHLSGNSRNNMAPIGTSVCLGQKLNPKNDTYAKTCSFWMQNTSKFWKIASGINILLVVSHTQVAPYHAIFIAPFFLAHQGGYLLVN